MRRMLPFRKQISPEGGAMLAMTRAGSAPREAVSRTPKMRETVLEFAEQLGEFGTGGFEDFPSLIGEATRSR